MPKKIPMRQCIGCGEMKEKKSLVRIIRSPEGAISLDRTGRANGRGAYLCGDVRCLRLAEKKKALNRAFGMAIPPEIYRELEAAFGDGADAGNGTRTGKEASDAG
ncbi:MAG: YlxR family protein [Eubacteriales bacterium]|nr:YlxR family protein [Eubacteriales bacterium]